MNTEEEPQLRFIDEADAFLVVTQSLEAPQFPGETDQVVAMLVRSSCRRARVHRPGRL